MAIQASTQPMLPKSKLRSIQSLESACNVLEKEYENCDMVKLDVDALKDGGDGLDTHSVEQFLNSTISQGDQLSDSQQNLC